MDYSYKSVPEASSDGQTDQIRRAESSGFQAVEEEDATGELGMKMSCDAYDAVIAASFGGIRITLPAEASGKAQFIRLHPIFIFAFCILLFVVQMSCLSCLIMDMELGQQIDVPSSDNWGDVSDDPRTQMMSKVKFVMVVVLQMVYIKEVLGALRPLCFIMNPVTWFELERPSTTDKGVFFHAIFCAPLCIMAQLLQFGIAYYVLTVSMSVIAISQNVKDVIFNGLVVTFLADLDEFAWTAAAAVFHLDNRYFEEFQFSIWDKETEKSKDDFKELKKAEVSRYRREARKGWKNYLYRGRGGKAVVLESLIVFTILSLMYIRQLFMFAQSIKTGILPVARDVCELYRGYKQPESYWKANIKLSLVDFFTVIPYRAVLDQVIEHEDFEQTCFTAEYTQGPFENIPEYIAWQPKMLIGGVCVIFLMFQGPQIVFAFHQRIVEFFNKSADSTMAPDSRSVRK